jgi:DNA-binding response OmpR family regulator
MATTSSQDTQSSSQRRGRVLCVDDDPQIVQSIKLRLERLGLEVDGATSGMAGFWLALEKQPDVIICDLVMPDGEGNYLLSRFRSHTVTRNVPVIILTGQKNPALRRQMLSVGATAYLTKPLSMDELINELTPYVSITDVRGAIERSPGEICIP